MDDRELLELAAKAAGIALDTDSQNTRYKSKSAFIPNWVYWNPLDDDGDALRLATRLCMSVSTGPCRAAANTIHGALRGAFFEEDTCRQDQGDAVRRVIVRAAAEVGEHMP